MIYLIKLLSLYTILVPFEMFLKHPTFDLLELRTENNPCICVYFQPLQNTGIFYGMTYLSLLWTQARDFSHGIYIIIHQHV